MANSIRYGLFCCKKTYPWQSQPKKSRETHQSIPLKQTNFHEALKMQKALERCTRVLVAIYVNATVEVTLFDSLTPRSFVSCVSLSFCVTCSSRLEVYKTMQSLWSVWLPKKFLVKTALTAAAAVKTNKALKKNWARIITCEHHRRSKNEPSIII